MANDAISISNQALLQLGQDVIQSFEEDSVEALTTSSFYEDAVKHALADIKPNFAIKHSAELVSIPVDPEFGWTYAHTLPQDNVLVLSINNEPASTANFARGWRIEGNTILSQRENIKVRYIHHDDQIEALFDSPFVQCLSAILASKCAYALTESSKKMRDMMALYESFKFDNYHINGMESSTVSTLSDQLTRVR